MKKSREERKKTILALMNDKHYVPMKEKELAVIMQVAPEDRPELSSILEELMLTGKIEANKRGKYSIAGTQDDTEKYPDSKVDIEKLKNWDINHIVGTYDKSNKSFGFVVPDNAKLSTDIYVKVEDSMGAVSGHKVVCELTNYGDKRHSPEGRIVEILGHVNDPGVDIMSIVKGFGLPMEYPDDVMRQTAGCADSVSEEETAGREDLRDVLMVTIDGEDSKDLDDAVSLTCTDDEYELGVHIADVSHYVREGSPLDKEALKRGTSVYLIDRVIPMLPHKLSNGICSLNAGEDRLALSCIMTIDRTGDVKNYRIVESVINVNHRMTYTSVNKMIYLKDEAERAEYADVADMLDHMYELSHIIRKNREKRGSIDFDLQETKIILDADGHPVDIHPYERNAATKLIEDFMLMANQTVAEHFEHLKIPFVYRTHEAPDPEKIEKLAAFINNHGYHLRGNKGEIHPKEIQKLLFEVEDTPEEALISRMTLRSMKQAKYTVDCSGHFGLAFRYYCHFTSPIRRYPDLQIHRIIKEWLNGRMDENRISHYEHILTLVSDKSSKYERRAEEAEREIVKLKKAQYMEERIGEEFEGVISGITEWGIYVELPSTVEGLVHISKLPGDYYTYDEAAYEMRGMRHGRKYLLGQEVKVRVDSVDVFMRTIDFSIVE